MGFSRHHQNVLLQLLVVALATAAAVAVPPKATAGGGDQRLAYVPPQLAAAARAHPSADFAVIVQGGPGSRSSGVADSVEAESAAADRGRAVGRRFQSISGVSATITGAELLRLAKRATILAITRDEHVSLGALDVPV